MKFWGVVIAIIGFIVLSMFAFMNIKQESIKVGLLYSQTGTMATNEIPVAKMFQSAVNEINKNGGIKNKKIQILEFDGKSDPNEFKKGAQQLIDEGAMALFGCWTSASRKMVKEVVEKESNLLFYPVQYEGLEQSPNIVYLGLSANQQINPTLSFIQEHFGNDVYLIGSDYIYPKTANFYIKELAKLTDLNIVQERYFKLGDMNFEGIAQEIKQLKPKAIINTINGDSNIAFFEELKKHGITSSDFPVFSLSLDESSLQTISQKIGIEPLIGHYATWGYFNIMNQNKSNDFTRLIENNLQDQKITDAMFSIYVGVELFKQVLLKSDEISTAVLQKNIQRASVNVSQNIYYVDGKNNHTHKKVLIGKITQNADFNIIWESQNIVAPRPYPEFKSREFWEDGLMKIYEDFGNSWEAK